jgi:hypothetical protein
VLPVLLEHGIGVLGMKPLAAGMILESGAVTAVECLHYVMNLPVSVVITGCESMERSSRPSGGPHLPSQDRRSG